MYTFGDDGELIARDRSDLDQVPLHQLDVYFTSEEAANSFFAAYIKEAGLEPVEGQEEIDDVIMGGQPELAIEIDGHYVVSLMNIPASDTDYVHNQVLSWVDRGLLPPPHKVLEVPQGNKYSDVAGEIEKVGGVKDHLLIPEPAG